MTSQIKDICDTFQRLTLNIANKVNEAGYTGLGIHEETITDLMLNQVQYEHAEHFITKKFTNKEEGSIYGADWLWCIGEPGSWITFAVQAKIANINTGRVNFLHYNNGKQYSLLINFAKQFHLIPKYSIYARVGEDIELFSRKVPELSAIPAEFWSYAVISPKYIKHLTKLNDKHISKVLQLALPWFYVFSERKNENLSIAEVIAKNFESVFWPFENEYRRWHKQNLKYKYKYMNWENPQPLKMISKSMPLLVLYFMTQKRIPPRIRISNVSIFSTKPMIQSLQFELAKIEGSKQWKNFPKLLERKIEGIEDSDRTYKLQNGRW